jgi:hypothetical protein
VTGKVPCCHFLLEESDQRRLRNCNAHSGRQHTGHGFDEKGPDKASVETKTHFRRPSHRTRQQFRGLGFWSRANDTTSLRKSRRCAGENQTPLTISTRASYTMVPSKLSKTGPADVEPCVSLPASECPVGQAGISANIFPLSPGAMKRDA